MCDGKQLSPGQATLPMLETGEHVITLAVEGPPNRSGEVSSDMRPAQAVIRIYVSKRPDHYWFSTRWGRPFSGWYVFAVHCSEFTASVAIICEQSGDSRRKP